MNHKISIYESLHGTRDSHELAENLTAQFAGNENDKKNIGVVSTGSAADHSLIGMLNFSFYDPRRKKVRMKRAGTRGYWNSVP